MIWRMKQKTKSLKSMSSPSRLDHFRTSSQGQELRYKGRIKFHASQVLGEVPLQ